MGDRAETLFPALVAVGLLLSAATLVIPWWTLDISGSGGASVSESARPFSTGELDEDTISENAVVATGVLAVVGLVCLAGSLALWGSARQKDEAPAAPSPWLGIAGGALMLIAALVAVATWPNGDLAFWDSASSSGFGVDTAAAFGWYLALVAGAVAAAGGFLGLGPSKADAKP